MESPAREVLIFTHNLIFCTEVDFDVEDVLVSHLVRTGQYYQLHQLLQYYVINDRKQMACKLLTLHRDYPPAIQLALDMLKRIGVKAYPGTLKVDLCLSRLVCKYPTLNCCNLKFYYLRAFQFLNNFGTVAKSSFWFLQLGE